MDLRTGDTVWQVKDAPPELYAPLENDIACEVAIVGGGITGALIAHELTTAGMDCVLLDKGAIGGGSTSASTALLLYELDTPLHELAEQIGETDAATAYLTCLGAIGKLEQVVAQLGEPCEFRHRSSYYLAEDERDVASLELECALRRVHGMQVDLLRRGEIEERFSFSRPAALLSPEAAEVDVVKLVGALIRGAGRGGLRVFGCTEMQRLDRRGDRFYLQTNQGTHVAAPRVVFATGYESEKYLGHKVGTLKSTYAIATEPIAEFRGWHERALLWTTAHPYLYLRTTADDRAVIGGEDIDFQDEKIRDALLPEKTASLEHELRAMFPEMEMEIACCWAGTFGETADSLAYIGEPADRPGIYFALGYGGNGITYGMVAAEIIREACCRREHPAARLFGFQRTVRR